MASLEIRRAPWYVKPGRRGKPDKPNAYILHAAGTGIGIHLSISWDAAIFWLRYIEDVSSSFPRVGFSPQTARFAGFFMTFPDHCVGFRSAGFGPLRMLSVSVALIFIKPKISFPINRITTLVPAYPQYCPRQM
jgi:hypothetical protein